MHLEKKTYFVKGTFARWSCRQNAAVISNQSRVEICVNLRDWHRSCLRFHKKGTATVLSYISVDRKWIRLRTDIKEWPCRLNCTRKKKFLFVFFADWKDFYFMTKMCLRFPRCWLWICFFQEKTSKLLPHSTYSLDVAHEIEHMDCAIKKTLKGLSMNGFSDMLRQWMGRFKKLSRIQWRVS